MHLKPASWRCILFLIVSGTVHPRLRAQDAQEHDVAPNSSDASTDGAALPQARHSADASASAADALTSSGSSPPTTQPSPLVPLSTLSSIGLCRKADASFDECYQYLDRFIPMYGDKSLMKRISTLAYHSRYNYSRMLDSENALRSESEKLTKEQLFSKSLSGKLSESARDLRAAEKREAQAIRQLNASIDDLKRQGKIDKATAEDAKEKASKALAQLGDALKDAENLQSEIHRLSHKLQTSVVIMGWSVVTTSILGLLALGLWGYFQFGSQRRELEIAWLQRIPNHLTSIVRSYSFFVCANRVVARLALMWLTISGTVAFLLAVAGTYLFTDNVDVFVGLAKAFPEKTWGIWALQALGSLGALAAVYWAIDERVRQYLILLNEISEK